MAEVNLAEIKFGGAVGDRQTAKLNSPPNFPAIRMHTKVFSIQIFPYIYPPNSAEGLHFKLVLFICIVIMEKVIKGGLTCSKSIFIF